MKTRFVVLPFGFIIWLARVYASNIFDLVDKGSIISPKLDEVEWDRDREAFIKL